MASLHLLYPLIWLMGIWVVFTLGLLRIILLWTLCTSFHVSLPLSIYLIVELLRYMVTPWLIFWGTTKLPKQLHPFSFPPAACEGRFFNAKEFGFLGHWLTYRTLTNCAFKDTLNAFFKKTLDMYLLWDLSASIQLKLKIHKFCTLPFYLIEWEAALNIQII